MENAREIIGKWTCPVCGEPAQELKINKNGRLYTYCDCGCSVSLSMAESRRLLPILRTGSSAKTKTGNLILSNKNKELTNNENRRFENERNSGNAAGRWTTGNSAARAGNNTGTEHGGGWLAGLLAGDDDE